MKLKGLDRYQNEDESWMPLNGPDESPFISRDQEGKEHEGEILVRYVKSKLVKKAALAFGNRHAKLMSKTRLSDQQEKLGERKAIEFCQNHLVVDTRGFVDEGTGNMIPEGAGGEVFARELMAYDWAREQVLSWSQESSNYYTVDDDDEDDEEESEAKPGRKPPKDEPGKPAGG